MQTYKAIITDVKGEIDTNTIIIDDVSIALSTMNR
jgi:hypothetical protein